MNRNDLSSLANPTGKKTIAGIIDVHAAERPSAAAFLVGDEELSWRQYQAWSDALAIALLEQGFERGDRIGILLPDSFEVHLVYVACEKAGLVGVALSPRAGTKEMVHLLSVSGAICLLSENQVKGRSTTELYQLLQQSVPRLKSHLRLQASLSGTGSLALNDRSLLDGGFSAPHDFFATRLQEDELFFINSTSGTTGTPKCVQQHQKRWFEFATLVQDSAPLTQKDVFLCALPASMGFGLWSGHFVPTLLGASTVLLPTFCVESLLSQIERQRVTVLSAVSTQFIMMINFEDLQQYDLRSLKVLYTGGEKVPYSKALRFEEVTGAKVLQFYGSNEAGALSYTSLRDSRELRLTTAGRIVPTGIRLIDAQGGDVTIPGVGQPVCKGPTMSYGYYNNEGANRRLFTDDGWMKVEDIVSIDDDGYLTVTGRVGDFIIRGGKNISSAAIEEAVLQHPDVKMAAAVAMPDAVFGEKVCVYIVMTGGGELGVSELAGFLQAQGVSKEYFPERVIAIAELPTANGGKIAKQVLRDWLKEESSDSAAI